MVQVAQSVCQSKGKHRGAMASASYTEDLTCSVCLAIFTDPVSLLCGHSFCRKCITTCLSAQDQCPQCRTTVPTDVENLPTTHILKSLAERAKESEKEKKTEVAESLCPEHKEKLKLFCETDQQLTCFICRDGEKHEGHKFKPIKEAAAIRRREMEEGMEELCGDIRAIESLAYTQRGEITKIQKKSHQLMNQISTQFKEMHQFLRKREDEIRNQLQEKEREAVEKMTKTLKAMDMALSESRELEVRVKSALETPDLERFLRSCTEGDPTVSPKGLSTSRAEGLQVAYTSLSLGPYESHLQFFVWKEMLQVIKPRPELLTVKKDNTNITVSDDGRSLFCTHKCRKCHPGSPFGSFASFFESNRNETSSINEFTSGQHYWEMEVGGRAFWELGLQHHFLKYNGQKYTISDQDQIKDLTYKGRPRKIGIYLDCSSKELSFYDADSMAHVHTMSLSHMTLLVSAYFNIGLCNYPDANPMAVCWY